MSVKEIVISSPQGEHHQVRVQECDSLCSRAQQAAAGMSGEIFIHEGNTGMKLIVCLDNKEVICQPELDKKTK